MDAIITKVPQTLLLHGPIKGTGRQSRVLGIMNCICLELKNTSYSGGPWFPPRLVQVPLTCLIVFVSDDWKDYSL